MNQKIVGDGDSDGASDHWHGGHVALLARHHLLDAGVHIAIAGEFGHALHAHSVMRAIQSAKLPVGIFRNTKG